MNRQFVSAVAFTKSDRGMWEAPGTPPLLSKTTGRAQVSLLETKEAVQHCRKWIEDCTGVVYEEQDFRKLLQDGVVLCRLIQHTSPGLIKKINSGKTPFAHRENLGFFLSACQKLGLKGGQLFDLEDLQEVSSARSSANESKIGRDEQERRLRNVAVTLYWLGRTVRNLKDYHGPQLDLSAFGGFVSPARPLPQTKQQSEVKSTPPVSSIKVTSRKVSSGSSSRQLGLPQYNSVELLISPSPSETRLSEFAFSGESPNCTSQHVPSAASPAEYTESKGLSLDLSKQLFTQTVIVGVRSPVRSQSWDTLHSVVAQSAEEDLSPTSADLPDKADLSASLDGRVLQAITEEEEKATKGKVQASADLLDTSSPLDGKKKASEVIEEAIAEQDSFQPVTSASPEILPSLEGDTPTSVTEEPCLDSCVPDQTPDERSMSGRRRMIIKPSAYGPRKQQELPTPTTSEGSDSTTGVISPAEDASVPQAAKERAGVVPPKPQPVPEAAFWDTVLTLQLQAKETKFGFRLSDAAGVGGLFPIEGITPGSPASRTDMRPSDLLLKVNSSSAEGLSYKQVITLVKKASGKKAMLVTLRRYRKADPQTQPQEACPVVSPLAVGPSDVTAQDTGSSENDYDQDPPGKYEPPGIVEVETGTMPELQHAQKVIYPVPSKGSGDDVFNDDIIPITNPSGTTSLFGGEARAISMGSIGSEEEEASEKPRRESESLMDSVMKETEHQTTTVEKPSPPPASTGKQAEMESPATPMQRYLDAKRLKDREIRRQQIDEGAKVYQNVQRNGRKWSKTDSLPNSRFRRNNSEDQLQGDSSATMPRARAYTSVSSMDEVSDLPSEKVKEKDEKVVDILKRLSISFRPLPAFEDDGYTTRKEAPADALPTVPQAIHTGSDSESGPPDSSMAEGEKKAVKQLRAEEEEGLAMKQPLEREGETKKQHQAQGEGKEVEQQLAEEKKLSYGERMEALLLAISSIHSKVGTEEDAEDLQSLERIINSPEMRKAVEMDEMMQGLVHNNGTMPKPVSKHLIPTSVMFRSALKHHSEPTKEIEELREFLRKPFVQGLFFCHDKVATRDFFVPESTPAYIDAAHPDLVSIPSDALDRLSNDPLYRKEQAVTIQITRTDKPLGMLVQCEENCIFIWQLLQDCDAARTGKFHVGDEVLEVNGITLTGMTTTQAMKVLMGLAGTHMTFSIIPTENPMDSNPALEPSFVRSHFDYDPMLDEDLPCREMGLEFRRGDIIEIINQDDVDWWQARIVDELCDCVPGLVPAKHLQEKRIALQHTYRADLAEMSKPKKKGLKALLPLKKKKRKTYYNQDQFQDGMGGEGVLVYEDVVKLQPSTDRNRPIVVIGAPGIGRKTLVRKLIDSNPEHFSTCVPHTSRTMRPGEVNGKDYYFVSREQMEREIRYGHFLEHGEHKSNLYGVSIETVMNLMKEGKVPVLDLHPQSLQILRSSTIMPYTVFIKAPSLDRLVATRQAMPTRKGKRDSTGFSEAEMEEIHRTSQQLEGAYGHFFDWIVVNDDLGVAADSLIEIAKRIEVEVQWVPASWCQDRAI